MAVTCVPMPPTFLALPLRQMMLPFIGRLPVNSQIRAITILCSKGAQKVAIQRDVASVISAFSLDWWRSKMRGVRSISRCVTQHRVNRGRDWLCLGQPGEHRAVSDVAFEFERRPLRNFERVKLGGRRARA